MIHYLTGTVSLWLTGMTKGHCLGGSNYTMLFVGPIIVHHKASIMWGGQSPSSNIYPNRLLLMGIKSNQRRFFHNDIHRAQLYKAILFNIWNLLFLFTTLDIYRTGKERIELLFFRMAELNLNESDLNSRSQDPHFKECDSCSWWRKIHSKYWTLFSYGGIKLKRLNFVFLWRN